MSSLLAVLFSFLLFGSIPLLLELFYRFMFNRSDYQQLKQQWQLLCEHFQLQADYSDKTAFSWARGFSLVAKGFVGQQYVHCSWKYGKQPISIWRVSTLNPSKLSFELDKELGLLNKSNVLLDDQYFRENFRLQSNNAEAIASILDQEMLIKIRKVFAIYLQGKLYLEITEGQEDNNNILDSGNAYNLVYSNTELSINNEKLRFFWQESLQTMLEIAQKIGQL